MHPSKVFGIGLSKTGITTLNEALQILGYSAIQYPVGLRGVEEHDAATDNPIADKLEALDQTYPGSKFIYTVRQRDAWLRSCRTHWARTTDRREEDDKINERSDGTVYDYDRRGEIEELRTRLYGTAEFDEDLFVAAYERHEKRVLDYFADRPEDLLVIDLCSGNDEWARLCSFLGKSIPDRPFPHLNTTNNDIDYRLDRLEWLPAQAKKQIRRLHRKTSRMFSFGPSAG
jgi:hypothetical protein